MSTLISYTSIVLLVLILILSILDYKKNKLEIECIRGRLNDVFFKYTLVTDRLNEIYEDIQELDDDLEELKVGKSCFCTKDIVRVQKNEQTETE